MRSFRQGRHCSDSRNEASTLGYTFTMPASPHELSATIRSLARDLGFDLAGIARVQPSAHPDAYKQWLAQGKHGEMSYLARHVDERLDLQKKFPWAKSVVCVALSYWRS